MLRIWAIVAPSLEGFSNSDGGVYRAWWTVIGQR